MFADSALSWKRTGLHRVAESRSSRGITGAGFSPALLVDTEECFESLVAFDGVLLSHLLYQIIDLLQ